MAKFVEGVGVDAGPGPTRVQPVFSSPPPQRARVTQEPVLTALPAVSLRGQIAELSGSMALSALFSALGTMLWAALSRAHGMQDMNLLGLVFFLTVATSWAVLVPAKFWSGKRG